MQAAGEGARAKHRHTSSLTPTRKYRSPANFAHDHTSNNLTLPSTLLKTPKTRCRKLLLNRYLFFCLFQHWDPSIGLLASCKQLSARRNSCYASSEQPLTVLAGRTPHHTAPPDYSDEQAPQPAFQTQINCLGCLSPRSLLYFQSDIPCVARTWYASYPSLQSKAVLFETSVQLWPPFNFVRIQFV